MTTAALIVAAGRGTRLASAGRPKVYLDVAGCSVLQRTVAAFAAHPAIDRTLVVIHRDDQAMYGAALGPLAARIEAPAFGGETRQESVRRGLEALARHKPRLVLVHDAARPFVGRHDIEAVVSALEVQAGAVLAEAVTDTIKRAGIDRRITETVPRDGLWRAQTPQGFDFAALLAAHQRAACEGRSDFTDDAALAEWAGLSIGVVQASGVNLKITTPADLALAERLARDAPMAWEPRTGQGFDVHRFVAGGHVWLCGVRVPHTHALEGHSDADVALHALTDALLGTIGDGDIGQHFPPNDPKWRGAPSHLFVTDAVRRVRERGGRISNADVTLLCEAPRISPHRDAMRARIAELLGIGIDRIGVKATTTEQLGFAGRREGMAAIALATVLLPTA